MTTEAIPGSLPVGAPVTGDAAIIAAAVLSIVVVASTFRRVRQGGG